MIIFYSGALTAQINFSQNKTNSLVDWHFIQLKLISNVAQLKDRQISLVEITDSNFRKGYFLISIGLADLIGIGLGYQISRNYSIGIKWGSYWIARKGRIEGAPFLPDAGGGFALRLSRTLDFKLLNNINSELMLFYTITSKHTLEPFVKGLALDINIGHENKISRGINFFWAIGFVVSSAEDVQPLYMPNLKIGINFNFY